MSRQGLDSEHDVRLERSKMRWPAVLLVLLVAASARADELSLPPGARPVQVAVGFFLVNLSGVAERNETFDADLYLSVRWKDPRVAFAGDAPREYLEDEASERLRTMWSPQLEFVNTADPTITNRALQITPDGLVRYRLGLTSEFRTNLDLRRFPFDAQRLAVRVQSFTWTDDEMIFVPDPAYIGFAPDSTFEGLDVTGVAADVRRTEIAGWGTAFSEFVAGIDVERRAAFYVWTVFAPVVLIFLISCTVFVVDSASFHDRVGISLAALLACIATQFAISFNLPQISYLTIIDRLFVVTYACVALGVLISTAQATLLRGDAERARRVDRWAGLGLPLLFAMLVAASL